MDTQVNSPNWIDSIKYYIEISVLFDRAEASKPGHGIAHYLL